jgi:F-type H+-transporting ATPase subunit delta
MPARSGSARRYADALFSLAVDRGTIDTWAAELTRLAHAVDAPGAERALMTPSVSLRDKQAALQTAAGPLSREVLFVVNLLLERKRIELLTALAEAFADRVRKHRGIELAEVTTAVPLADADRQLIAQRLEQTLGHRVEMTTRVDPEIMGGVVVRVGDQLFDASVRGKLERLRRRLAAGVYSDDGPQPVAAR